MSGAIAAPTLEPMANHDTPLEVSLTGNHRATTAPLVGKAPDSPTPNKNRTMSNEINPVVKPVSTVNNDHHKTMRMNTTRWPIRSPSIPEGISNKAYAREKEANTQPNCSLVKLNSDFILTPNNEILILSRYVIKVKKKRNTNMQ